MDIVKDVTHAVQSLLEDSAIELAQECDVIKRKRKFSATTLAQTFVLGFLQNPNASDELLAQMAGVLGVPVTPQAVEQRFSPELVRFLQMLFESAVKHAVKSQASLAPLLERFSDVLMIDSTTISLPPELAEEFPGCGGSYGSGAAAVKLQVRLSLKTGALDAVNIEPGRDCDMKTPLQSKALPKNALRIADLGYFNTEVFGRFEEEGVYWLSRLLFGTNVYDVDGCRLDTMRWLAAQDNMVDRPILLGARHRVACRLVAWRVPQEVAARRRQKLIQNARRKGRTPTAARLAWCDWTILVTNVPVELLTPHETCVLYRSRWQIELLFKRWKSQGQVAKLAGATVTRKMVRLWARLLAVTVQHWLVIASVWGNPRISLKKACDAIHRFAIPLAMHLNDPKQFECAIKIIIQSLESTARQNKRKRPSTMELLQDPNKITKLLT